MSHSVCWTTDLGVHVWPVSGSPYSGFWSVQGINPSDSITSATPPTHLPLKCPDYLQYVISCKCYRNSCSTILFGENDKQKLRYFQYRRKSFNVFQDVASWIPTDVWVRKTVGNCIFIVWTSLYRNARAKDNTADACQHFWLHFGGCLPNCHSVVLYYLFIAVIFAFQNGSGSWQLTKNYLY